MAFNPDQFLAETEPTQAQGGFDPDKFLSETASEPWKNDPVVLPGMEDSVMTPKQPVSYGQEAKNLWEDVKSIPAGLGQFAKTALTQNPIKTFTKDIPNALSAEFNRLGGQELLSGEYGDALNQFAKAGYEKPLTTALDISGAVEAPFGIAKGLSGLKRTAPIAEAAPLAEKIAPLEKVAETTKAPIEPIAKVPKTAPGVPPKPVAPFEDVISSMKKAVPEAVKKPAEEVAGYLTEKYGDKPLNKGTIGPYIEKNARNMTMKTLGASPGQIRKIGIEKAQKLADYAQEKGIVNYKTGDIGAGQKVDKIHQDSGQVIGDMRGMVAERGAVHDPVKLIQDIHSKIGKEYESGLHSGEQNSYLKALQEVYNTPPTPDAIAKTITKLFQESKNMDRLKQPSGAMADVARELRTKNEAIMSKYLDPTEQKLYHNALEDFGATTQIKEFMKRKESTEMGGRLPPGMGLTRAALQKTLDVVGYRGMAQLQHNVAKWIKSNPKATVTPRELFRKYVDEAVEAIDDIGEGLQ